MTPAAADPLSPEGLAGLLAEAGISVSGGAREKLARHAREMLRWNRAIRLTAIADPLAVAVKHIVDSLFLLRFGPFPGRTLDFGSGAGYPGIPLAVCAPESRVVLLEATAKKCAFLSHVRAALDLSNVEVVHGRLEKGRPRPIGPFDQIVTRAAAARREAEELLLPHLAPGGRLLLMAGPGPGGAAAGQRRKGGDVPRGTSERSVRFQLPRGMGAREIREIRLP